MNGGKLPPHVVPFCAVGAVLAALLPVASEVLQRSLAACSTSQPEGPGEESAQPRPSRLSRSSQVSLAVSAWGCWSLFVGGWLTCCCGGGLAG